MHITPREILASAAALLLLLLTVLWLALPGERPAPLSFRPLPPAENRAESRLNINEASAPELMELPGIGDALSEKILQQRSLAPLTGPEDLLAVSGIGPATLQDVEAYITYEGVLP